MRKITVQPDSTRALEVAGQPHRDWPSGCLTLAGRFTDFPLPQSENDGLLSATATRGKDDLLAASSAFESEFAQWIEAENKRVESRGIPGAEFRPW